MTKRVAYHQCLAPCPVSDRWVETVLGELFHVGVGNRVPFCSAGVRW